MSESDQFLEYIADGDYDNVKKLLLKGINPAINENAAIIIASCEGHTEIIRLLIEEYKDQIDPSENENEALDCAVNGGHIEIVRLLLSDKRIDPTQDDNSFIQTAYGSGNEELVKLFLNDSRVIEKVKKTLNSPPPTRGEYSKYATIKKIAEKYLPKYTSPKEYKTELKVLESVRYKPIDEKYEIKIMDDINLISLESFNDRFFKIDINFASSIQPLNSNIVYSSQFKSFLCELELFNWKKLKHSKNIDEIKGVDFFGKYTDYLCNTLGNDITLYRGTLIPERIQYFDIPKMIYNNFTPSKYDENLIIGNPFLFDAIKLKCIYSEQILKSDTRYTIINSLIEFFSGSHYTFVFIDSKNKIIEYYDSNGGSLDSHGYISNEFVYSSFQKLYPGYKINEFWKHEGIQNVEDIEKDQEGFCVIWGHMMMHLKLLNLELPMSEIEKLFIKECYDKKLSLYEVMLNYAYFMKRMLL